MYLEIDRIRSDPHVLLWEESAEILVDRLPHTLHVRDHAKPTWLAVSDVRHICKQIEDRKIMLDHQYRALVRKFPDHDRSTDALVDVEIRAYLIEKIEICIFGSTCSDRNPLKLATAEIAEISVKDVSDLEFCNQVPEFTTFIHFLEQFRYLATEYLGKSVHVLRFL